MSSDNSASTAKLVYILYLVSIFLGITGLIGVIMAYINKGDAPDWLKTHYQFQIRTFWISILYSIIGIVTLIFVIGYFILLFLIIWYIVRCVKGLKQLGKNAAMENPKSWMFG